MAFPNSHRPVYRAYIFDLDGTIYLGDRLLPGVRDTILTLHAAGARLVFLSNNPTSTRAGYAQKLVGLGIPASIDNVVHATFATITYLQKHLPEACIFPVGESPLHHELRQAGFTISDQPDKIDVVLASFDRTFTYQKLQVAFDAIRSGARFFATNSDRYCPTPNGGEPDAAAIIAAIEACTNIQVEIVFGKPSRYMIQAALRVARVPPSQCLMTGDRLETDIAMGHQAGMHTALTLTGATSRQDAINAHTPPTFILETLSDLLRLPPPAIS